MPIMKQKFFTLLTAFLMVVPFISIPAITMAANQSPVGYVDGFKSNSDVLAGWAVDGDSPSQSLAIHIYLDKSYAQGGQLIGYLTASIPRSDVNSVTQLPGDHGFEFTIPAQYKDGTTHSLYIYAIDPQGGENPQLNGSPFPFQINALGNGSVSSQVNGSTLTLKTAAWVAGAITSLNFRGVEFIDSYDHGRELQTAVQFNNYGECYNPTEGGPRDDGTGLTSTSLLKAFNASGNTITSTNQMAFWLWPGQSSSGCGNASVAQNTTKLSDYILEKNVSIGFQNIPNVIKYTATFTVPRAHSSAVFAPTTGYTPSSFSEFWTFSTTTKQASMFSLSGTLTEQGKPTIFATPDHNSAIAIYSPNLPDQFNLGYAIGKFDPNVTDNHPTNEFGCVHREYNLVAKQYSYTCYVVVGTFNEVTNSLKSLVDYFHPTTTPNPTAPPVLPSTASIITTSLPSGTQNQPYSASIEISANGQISPNITVANLPQGISVSNASAGWPNAIYGDGNKNSNGYYHVDLSGTSTQTGTSEILVEVFNTTHSFNITKKYSLTINPPSVNPAPSTGQAHPNNTNILGPDGTVYLIQGGYRSPYTSAGAFLSYGFNTWAGVMPATTGDMNLPLSNYTPSGSTNTTTYFIPPRNGSLINDKGTIYLITNGLRIGFASEQAFLGLGYSYATVQPGDTSFMVALAPINNSAMSHPDGTLVNDNGTIYIMKNNTRMGFPSLQIFFSWGFELNEVVPANSYDRGAPVSGLVNTRMANQLSI